MTTATMTATRPAARRVARECRDGWRQDRAVETADAERRRALISRIRTEVRSGTYVVDASELARAMAGSAVVI